MTDIHGKTFLFCHQEKALWVGRVCVRAHHVALDIENIPGYSEKPYVSLYCYPALVGVVTPAQRPHSTITPTSQNTTPTSPLQRRTRSHYPFPENKNVRVDLKPSFVALIPPSVRSLRRLPTADPASLLWSAAQRATPSPFRQRASAQPHETGTGRGTKRHGGRLLSHGGVGARPI